MPKFVARAPEPEDVVLAAVPLSEVVAALASATWIPKPVVVSTTVLPLEVTVVVTTEVAVVDAVHAVQLNHGAPVE